MNLQPISELLSRMRLPLSPIHPPRLPLCLCIWQLLPFSFSPALPSLPLFSSIPNLFILLSIIIAAINKTELWFAGRKGKERENNRRRCCCTSIRGTNECTLPKSHSADVLWIVLISDIFSFTLFLLLSGFAILFLHLHQSNFALFLSENLLFSFFVRFCCLLSRQISWLVNVYCISSFHFA